MAKKILRAVAVVVLGPPALVVVFIAVCSAWITAESWGKLHDDPAMLPASDVALVLGTSDRLPGGGPNMFFQHRMEAAARLYEEGAVRHILVSGDNRSPYYNEPRRMQRALNALGVPDEAITLDYAGLRTLDSVVRAREIFGQESIIIVTQRFHNRRAVFLANRFGLDATGFNAEPVRFPNGIRPRLRELLARCKAVLDVTILDTQPRYLGDAEPITLDALPTE